MQIRKDHELHIRRRRSNYLLGGVLLGFIVLIYFLTIAKMKGGASMEAYDYTYRPSLTVEE